jgi:enediyne biosynthesis protein E4
MKKIQVCEKMLLAAVVIFFNSCKEEKLKLFTKLSSNQTGIDFQNTLTEDNPGFNILTYPYYYNGGGIAVGDINNDGLTDICFTGNLVKNRLYINKGDFKFEDITEKSGIADKGGWCTGVTMADINNDGWQDIYICRSGLKNANDRRNLLFINNKNLGFAEKAAEYGLDDPGYSTQASFFDYDKDGDLDMFIINQSSPEYSKGKMENLQLRFQRGDTTLENKLYRNDNGHFENVTTRAGIGSNKLTFSLGISTADINQDGWPDIYVGNDFKEPDYLYLNNKDGTFSDNLEKHFNHTSLFSMGIDINDYNNDLLPDIVELDMLPEDNYAFKTHLGADNFEEYNYFFKMGMPRQYMKNCLQKNNGDGSFSEIGQLAGISNTDWSWAPLFADFDNDGLKDLFVSNGYKRNNTDMEFIKYLMDKRLKVQRGEEEINVVEYISRMPSIKLPNYIFQNKGNDQFEQKMKDWGLDEPSVSQGCAYADIDNDGDLDIIINNTEGLATVYRNNSEHLIKNNFLRVQLQGDSKNSLGIGTKVLLYAGSERIYQEQLPVRGFQSSVDPVLHFGLSNKKMIDSLVIIWPDDKMQVLKNVKGNQTLRVNKNEGTPAFAYPINPPVKGFFEKETSLVNYIHKENEFSDFTIQSLLPQYYSRSGPCMARGDINGDGLEDIFIGGAKGTAAGIFLQTAKHSFISLLSAALQMDSSCENTDALFFDADNDKDLDLYVVSGGYEFAGNPPELNDRLYSNDGKGHFTKKENVLPSNMVNKSCVRQNDIDGDGDLDLFIGGTVTPGKWPQFDASRLLLNDGKGQFTNVTQQYCKTLSSVGMVKDAAWIDVNKDKIKDLIVVGEWMPVKIFINKGNSLEDDSDKYISFSSSGWWNKILVNDFDNDGDEDIVLGNYGMNGQLSPSEKEPVQLYNPDIDGNGKNDPILTSFVQGKSYPFITMDDILFQVPSLKKKFYNYNSYADAVINDLIPLDKLSAIISLQSVIFKTVYLENSGNGLIRKELPVQAQYSPVYAMCTADVNADGNSDLLLFGNNQYNRMRLSQYDANFGQVYLGDGKGNFSYLQQMQSGLSVIGDVRSVQFINDMLLIAINNRAVQAYRLKKK